MKAGDIVICVNNTDTSFRSKTNGLVLGGRYKVEKYYCSPLDDIQRVEIIINNEFMIFYSYRFKPLNRQEKLERILK